MVSRKKKMNRKHGMSDGDLMGRRCCAHSGRKRISVRSIGEAEVTVLVQDGGQVWQVQGEGEERPASSLALLQTLFPSSEQEGLFFQQGGFAVSAGLPTPTPVAVFSGTDRRSPFTCVLPAPPPDFSGRDGG